MKKQTDNMAKPQRTEAQRVGIYDRSGSLVVSASAGTGKTTVLTDRCVDLVAGKDRIEIDRLLVVTFTEAAALEMRERIRAKLRDMYEQTRQGRLLRELTLLDAASISTLHSFCLQVVRENFGLAGIEPDAGVLGDDEAQMLQDEVLSQFLETLYSGDSEEAKRFVLFVAHYGQGRDEGIRRQVRHLHEYLRSLPPPRREEWKRQAVAAYTLDAGGMLTAEQFGQLREAIVDEIDLMLEMGRMCADAFEGRFGPHQGLNNARAVHEYATQLRDELGKVRTPAGLKAWIERAGTLPWDRVKSWKDVPETCKGWAEWLKDEWKKTVVGRWVTSAEAWAHGIAITQPYAELLVWLVGRFGELYSQEKRRIGKIDYSDMEEYAFALLAGEDGGPSEIARAFQQRYDVVLVDEFQDTNPIQAAIVHLVSRESAEQPEPNLFVVGDVKQSIYGFRMTDPELFRRRQQQIEGKQIRGRCVSLQENFRSRPEVLGFVNRLFRKLMQEAETQVAYDEAAELKAGRSDFPEVEGPKVELHVLEGAAARGGEAEEQAGNEEETADREREAQLVAGRIRELLGQPYLDKHGNVGRLSYRDMVILLRSTQAAAPEYADVLRRAGIPVYAELRSGYFASREVKDMLSLLQVLENMQQDIPLASVLRSPLFGEALCDAELAEIRLARPELEFHQAVRAYAEGGAIDTENGRTEDRGLRTEEQQQPRLASEPAKREDGSDRHAAVDVEALRRKVARQVDLLDRWRREARLRPLAEVIAGIYQETGLLEYVTLLEDGAQCRANLVSLYERARQFGQFSRQGLRRFVTFVTEMIRAGRETTAPTAVGEGQDVVRIMSIHASKGLEFPVVFLADLARKFNDLDFTGSIVLDRAGTLGIEARDPQRMVRSDTLVKLLAAGRVRRQNRAEELRVLYVAMTRAKERLVLVGTRAKAAEWMEGQRELWRECRGPLPRHVVRRAGCVLDWIVPAVVCSDDNNEGSGHGSARSSLGDNNDNNSNDNKDFGHGLTRKDTDSNNSNDNSHGNNKEVSHGSTRIDTDSSNSNDSNKDFGHGLTRIDTDSSNSNDSNKDFGHGLTRKNTDNNNKGDGSGDGNRGLSIGACEAARPVLVLDGGAMAVFLHSREEMAGWKTGGTAERLSGREVLAALDGKAEKTAEVRQVIARLRETYEFERLTRVPAITPVTELKGRLRWDDEEEDGEEHRRAAAYRGNGQFGVPRQLRPVASGDAARQKGTATHLFLEKVDLAGPVDRRSLAGQLKGLVERRLLSGVEAEQIDLESVEWLLNETELGRQLRANHGAVHREMPFILRLEPERLTGGGSKDLADWGIVRGVIDVLWTTAEGIEIADFKTDAVEGAELRRRIELYKGQLRMYALAIGRIWKRPVCRLWLAFLHARHVEPFGPAGMKG